jgi:molybdopterin-containing oxidoreductase family membrane subunit
MIPDMALLRDHPAEFAPWRRWIYRRLALGWSGTPEQWRRLERAISVMAIVIIPVAISVHTVVS